MIEQEVDAKVKIGHVSLWNILAQTVASIDKIYKILKKPSGDYFEEKRTYDNAKYFLTDVLRHIKESVDSDDLNL